MLASDSIFNGNYNLHIFCAIHGHRHKCTETLILYCVAFVSTRNVKKMEITEKSNNAFKNSNAEVQFDESEGGC